jgi:hypothetical protein
MDLFDKARQDMDAEFKKSFKWVVLVAVFGLVVLLMFYVMVVMAQADSSDIAIRSNTVIAPATNSAASVSLTA